MATPSTVVVHGGDGVGVTCRDDVACVRPDVDRAASRGTRRPGTAGGRP